MAERNNTLHKTITWFTVIALGFTITGFIWAAATQNNKLENVLVEQAEMKPKVISHEKSINVIETQMNQVLKQLERIERAVNRNDRTTKNSENQ